MRALAILLILTSTAAAEPYPHDVCDDPIDDPVAIGMRAGGFDAPRSACLRATLDARVRGHALIDTPEFYGTLGGEVAVGLRFVEDLGLEWGATVRLVDVTFAQTAVITDTELRYGPVSVHAAMDHRRSSRLRLAGLLGLEVPFTRSELETSTAGAQLAGLATWRALDRVAVHGRVAALGWYGSSVSGTSVRGAAVVSADAAIRTVHWLHAFAGLEASAGWYRGGVDHVAARVGAHWRVYSRWRVDVGAIVPVLGKERLDLAFTIGVHRDRE